MAMFYIRYKQIATYQKDCPVRIITRVNMAALVMGLFSAFGISLVGNFQVNENVNETHLTFELIPKVQHFRNIQIFSFENQLPIIVLELSTMLGAFLCWFASMQRNMDRFRFQFVIIVITKIHFTTKNILSLFFVNDVSFL